jgi:D-arabinose 1-dehydrogenase-like Zn-dependent alcohol dehydrogenase
MHVANASSAKARKIPSVETKKYSVYCAHAEKNGLSRDGGFGEHAVVDARQLEPIPDSLTAIETPLLMCVGITVRTFKATRFHLDTH